MKMGWGEQTRLEKAAAVLMVVALASMAVWGLSVYAIHGDGDTYPGGALGVAAVIGVAGTVAAVGGLLVVCGIGFVRLVMRSFRQQGER